MKMAGKKRKIYKKSKPWKVLLIVFLSALLFFIILTVSVFFGFQKYIVYTNDGLRVEVPWLSDTYSSAEAENTTALSYDI